MGRLLSWAERVFLPTVVITEALRISGLGEKLTMSAGLVQNIRLADVDLHSEPR
jgi:hypothetical protein